MSLEVPKNEAMLTVFGYGWNDTVNDSGDGKTEDGLALEDFCYDLNYDFGDDFDWESLAQDLDISLDLDGDIDLSQQESLSQDLTNLADNEEAIYNYMTDHGDSSGIPARIRVTNPPDKLEYNDGDEIDFTGLVVCAYSSLTTRTPFIRQEWEGPRHNQIPFDELSFPVTVAEGSGDIRYSNTEVIFVIAPIVMFSGFVYYRTNDYNPGETYEERWTGHGAFMSFISLHRDLNDICRINASSDPDAYIELYHEWPADYGKASERLTTRLNRSYTKDGKTVYYSYSGAFSLPISAERAQQCVTDTWQRPYYVSKADVAWAMIYGELSSESTTVTIPVQWQTEYWEEPYEASFEIQVT